MTEQERIKKLANIQIRKEEMKKLKEKRVKVNQLKKNPYVKQYLKLSKELEEEPIYTASEIEKEAFGIYCDDCNHEFYFFMRGIRRYHYAVGYDDKEDYCYEDDDEKIEFYVYSCLDCTSDIYVPKAEHEDFLKTHKVIRISNLQSDSDFHACRALYHKLLLTNSVEQSYKKLQKKVQK